MDLETRCERLREELATIAPIAEHLGMSVERPVMALLDGYPDSAVNAVAKTVEAVLKAVWRASGVKGDSSRETLEPLMRRCRPKLEEQGRLNRRAWDYMQDIQRIRNRELHHQVAGDDDTTIEDAIEATRRLPYILLWYREAFVSSAVDQAGEPVPNPEITEQLDLLRGMYAELGYRTVKARVLTSSSAYLLLGQTAGARADYVELLLSTDRGELEQALQSTGDLFSTAYPKLTRYVLFPGQWSAAPDALPPDAQVVTFAQLLCSFFDARRHTGPPAVDIAAAPVRVGVPGHLLRLDELCHTYTVTPVDDAVRHLQDHADAKARNLLVTSRPGGGKTQAVLELIRYAERPGSGRLAFYFDLGLKRESEPLSGFVDRELDGLLVVEPRRRFGFFAHLVRRGLVLAVFDGVDEGQTGNDRNAFLALFAELAELLSSSSTVVLTSRESFLMESPYVRQLLDRDALVSERLARDLTSSGVDPLALPNFDVLRLTDVDAEPLGLTGVSPLEAAMLDVVDGAALPRSREGRVSAAHLTDEYIRVALDEVGGIFDRQRWGTLLSVYVRDNEVLDHEEIVEAFGNRLLRTDRGGVRLRDRMLLRPMSDAGAKFRHRLFLEYVVAHAIASGEHPADPLPLTPLIRTLLFEVEGDRARFGLAPRTQTTGGVLGAGSYVVGPPDSPMLRRLRRSMVFDASPVTAGQLRLFVEDVVDCDVSEFEHPLQPADHVHEPTWRKLRFGEWYADSTFADHPAVCVPWWTAYAYAKWAGKRLPTSVEWECAARGWDGRLFSWGDAPDPARANCSDFWAGRLLLSYDEWKAEFDSGRVGRGHALPVDQHPENVSPIGCLGMSGNVWEWTNTTDHERGRVVICGGSYDNPLQAVRASQKGAAHMRGGSNAIGFRCVADV